MSYLVDSDWVADYLADRRYTVALLTELASTGLVISLITYGEIYEGVLYGRDPRQAEAGFDHFIRGVDVLPLTQAIMRRFAAIRGATASTRSAHRRPDTQHDSCRVTIGLVAAAVAACAEGHVVRVLTADRRRFDVLAREEP